MGVLLLGLGLAILVGIGAYALAGPDRLERLADRWFPR